MSDLAAIIAASTGVLTASGAGIAFVWNKIDKGLKQVRTELAECQKREKRQLDINFKQLLVIELLWQVAPKTKAASDVLARCKGHLDELKTTARELREKEE